MIQNGESLKYVQEQLGHGSIQITADVYSHLIPGANRAASIDWTRNPSATQTQLAPMRPNLRVTPSD